MIKPFYLFGIDRTIQNTVGEQDYGLYYALFNFAFLFQIINDLGLQNYNNRNIAQHRYLLSKYFPHFLWLKLGLGIIYLLSLLGGALLFGYELAVFPILFFVGINWMLNAVILFMRSNISGLGFYRTDSLLSVLDRLLLIGLCGYLLWYAPFRANFQIEWFVYAQTCTLALTLAVAFSIVAKQLKHWSLRFSWPLSLLLLKKSYPYALVIFLMLLYTRVDAFMIERLREDGAYQAGLYATAYRLLDASNILGLLFATLLLPMFSRMIKLQQEVESLLRMSFKLIWAGAYAIACACILFREEIMMTLYDSGSAFTADTLAWLMLSFLSICGCYIYGTLLTANGNLRRMNQVFVLGVLLNISLNLWLIPHSGALGAAIATCFTQALVWLSQVFLVKRMLHIPFGFSMFFQLILFSGVALALNILLVQSLAFDWFVKFLLCILSSLGLAFFFKLINPISTLQMLGKYKAED